MSKYLLVTPCKNESSNLIKLIDSVKNQSIKPSLWIIIDDASTDNSLKIIQNNTKNTTWIKCISLRKNNHRDSSINYSRVCKKGFDFGSKLLKKNHLHVDYIGLLDADMLPSVNYFQDLIAKFESDTKLGIVSGGVYLQSKFSTIYEKSNIYEPRGGARLWRIKCFIETGGYEIGYSPDTISNVKAIIMGWKIKQIKEIKVIQTRKTFSGEGLWKGYLISGKSSYYIGCHPIYILGKSFLMLFKFPYYLGIPFAIGYFDSLIKRKPKHPNQKILAYYGKNKLQSYFVK
jgi:glycosyltransferase involved in cell wall biosynthesis